jgi:hypothetical protein
MRRLAGLFLLLFITVPVFEFRSPVQAEVARLPGVHVGDWARYDAFYNSTTNDPDSPIPQLTTGAFEEIDYFKTTVQSVRGTNITFQIMVRLKNGTEMSSVLSEDFASASMGPTFFVAANLTAGDALYAIPSPYSPVINATLLRTYAGAKREVNSWTQTRDLAPIYVGNHTYRVSGQAVTYWDRASGILDEMVQDAQYARVPEGYVTRTYLRFLVVETNIWNGRNIAIIDAKTGLNLIRLEKGSSFTVNVTLGGTTDYLHGFQVAIKFDNTRVKCNASWTNINDPNQVFYGQSGLVMGFFIVNNRAGFTAVGETLGIDYVIPLGESRHYVNVSSGRLLCQLNFTAVGEGNSSLELVLTTTSNYYYYTSLVDSNNKQIEFVGRNFSVNVPVTQMIIATVVLTPSVLNLKSRGRWIAAFIELPKGYDIKDIDLSTITLNQTIHQRSGCTYFGKSSCLMIKFERQAVIDLILRNHQCGKRLRLEKVTLTIAGKLKDGTVFQGSDTVTVLWKSILRNPSVFHSN